MNPPRALYPLAENKKRRKMKDAVSVSVSKKESAAGAISVAWKQKRRGVKDVVSVSKKDLI